MVVLLKPRTIDTTGADDTNRVLQWDPVTHELHYAPATIGVSYMGTAVAAHTDSVDFIGDGVAVTMVGDQLTVNVPKTDLSKAPGKFRGEWTDASLFKTYTFSDGTIPPEFLLEHGDVASNPLVVAATVDVYTKVVQLSINKGNTYDLSKMSLTLSALNVFGIVKAKFWTYNDGGFNATSMRTQVLKNGTTLINRTGGYGWTEDTVACTENDVLAWQAIGTGNNITVNARSQVAGIRFYATTDPYMLGHFVAYQGLLYRSAIDNNGSTPGTNTDWVEVPVSRLPRYTTANRTPTLAATLGAGQLVYDTDMAQIFVSDGAAWAAASGSTATLYDAKGDILVGSADNSPNRLGVGPNGQVLTTDSTAPLGVKWATPSASGGGGSAAVGAGLTLPANQAVTVNGEVIVALSTPDATNDPSFTVVSNGLQVPSAGWYAVNGYVRFTAGMTNATEATARLTKNAVTIAQNAVIVASTVYAAALNTLIYCAAGDLIQLRQGHGGSGSLTIRGGTGETYLRVVRIG